VRMSDQDGENPASKVGNWLETTRSDRAVDGGDHRPMSRSGAMLNGQTFLAREGGREIRTGTKSRGRKTRTARSGADVWIKGEKERVSRSRAKTSGVPTRARYAPPKLVSGNQTTAPTVVLDLTWHRREHVPIVPMASASGGGAAAAAA
jgi:hypothetical protein